LRELNEALEGHANIDKACKEYARWYARNYYHAHKERNNEVRREARRQRIDAEGPGERETRLGKRRKQYRQRKQGGKA
jgi:hypothetical protein